MSIFNRYKDIGEVKDFDPDQHDIELLDEEKKEFKPLLGPFVVALILVLVVVTLKLTNLQIIQGSENLYAAQGNFIRKRAIPAPRGLIVDVKGRSLVSNSAALDLAIYPGELPLTKSDRLKLYDQLINELGASRESLQEIEEKELKALDPIVIKANLSQEEAVKTEVSVANYPGVAVIMRPSRRYLADYGLSHILGYIAKINDSELEKYKEKDYRLDSMIGRSGIEYEYEDSLKGKDGYSIVEVDSKGKVEQTKPGDSPKIGNTVQLSLDLDLQKFVYTTVQNYINEKHNTKVVAIVSKSQTGEIEAMVSTPSYDNNSFLQGISLDAYQTLINDKDLPLLNRAVAGSFASGSSIKPVIASAALAEGTITASTTINTPPVIIIGQWTFPDNKAHGYADVKKAIAESNNVFFYALGGGFDKITGLGPERMESYLRKFGFGSQTGIDLPGEQAGFIPDPDNKLKQTKESWYIGDSYHLAIGQGGFLVTPIQMVQAISTIANGGKLTTPHLLKSINNVDSSNLFPNKSSSVVPDNFLQTVREGMRQTVTDGSARSLNTLPIKVAGKTGTAQFGTENKTHAWFVSYAPYEHPEHTIVVLVEGGGEGWDQAEPMAKLIYQYLYPQ